MERERRRDCAGGLTVKSLEKEQGSVIPSDTIIIIQQP